MLRNFKLQVYSTHLKNKAMKAAYDIVNRIGDRVLKSQMFWELERYIEIIRIEDLDLEATEQGCLLKSMDDEYEGIRLELVNTKEDIETSKVEIELLHEQIARLKESITKVRGTVAIHDVIKEQTARCACRPLPQRLIHAGERPTWRACPIHRSQAHDRIVATSTLEAGLSHHEWTVPEHCCKDLKVPESVADEMLAMLQKGVRGSLSLDKQRGRLVHVAMNSAVFRCTSVD